MNEIGTLKTLGLATQKPMWAIVLASVWFKVAIVAVIIYILYIIKERMRVSRLVERHPDLDAATKHHDGIIDDVSVQFQKEKEAFGKLEDEKTKVIAEAIEQIEIDFKEKVDRLQEKMDELNSSYKNKVQEGQSALEAKKVEIRKRLTQEGSGINWFIFKFSNAKKEPSKKIGYVHGSRWKPELR